MKQFFDSLTQHTHTHTQTPLTRKKGCRHVGGATAREVVPMTFLICRAKYAQNASLHSLTHLLTHARNPLHFTLLFYSYLPIDDNFHGAVLVPYYRRLKYTTLYLLTFFVTLVSFIPRRDSAKQSPMGSILILSTLLWSEKGI